MKKLLLLFAAMLLPLFVTAQNKKVAVYVMGEDAGINKVLGSKLVSAIAQSEEYTAIERTAAFLAQLSKEQNYQRTGTVDDRELSRLGKQFGVQYVCVAAVSEAFNEKYLSVRLIDVESAQVERTASSSGTIQSLPDIINAANSVSNELISSLGSSRQSNLRKVAVYIVKNDAAKNIGRVLGDKLVAGFTNSGRYIAIERTNSFLSQLSKEQKYQRTGAVDDSDISRLGKQFGVQYVCVADVSDVFGEKYISARLIDVETAEVVNTHDEGGSINTMQDCIRKADNLAYYLSGFTFQEQEERQQKLAHDLTEQVDSVVYDLGAGTALGDHLNNVPACVNLAGWDEKNLCIYLEKSPYLPPCSYEITKKKDIKTLIGQIKKNTKETFNNPGGFKGLCLYLIHNLSDAVEKYGNEGGIDCSFIVERDGSITNVQVLRNDNPKLCQEAVRVLKNMPKWEPGKKYGIPVRVKYTIPIGYILRL